MSKNTSAMARELTARQLAERAEWKRRQAIQPSLGTLLAPTLPERIARLNPSERHDLGRLLKSLKLRKIIKRTLAEAFWNREVDDLATATMPRGENATMQRLRASVRSQESMKSYDSALTSFEPVYTHSTHGTGTDSPVITEALHSAMKELR